MPNKKLDTERAVQRRLEYLRDKECAFCTEDEVDRLTILHREPGKHLAYLWGLTRSKREKLLEDAIVVCRSCRATRTGVGKNLRRSSGPRANAVRLG